MKKPTVFDCGLIHFPRIQNRAGNLTAVQNNIEVPFSIKRIYYLYDIPGGESRGAHAHFKLEQVIIAASGSFDITIDDGRNKKTVNLSRSYYGFHLLPGLWRDISNFSSGAILMVLASEPYDEKDYIRSYDEYLKYASLPG